MIASFAWCLPNHTRFLEQICKFMCFLHWYGMKEFYRWDETWCISEFYMQRMWIFSTKVQRSGCLNMSQQNLQRLEKCEVRKCSPFLVSKLDIKDALSEQTTLVNRWSLYKNSWIWQIFHASLKVQSIIADLHRFSSKIWGILGILSKRKFWGKGGTRSMKGIVIVADRNYIRLWSYFVFISVIKLLLFDWL